MKARTAKIRGGIIVGGDPAGAVTALHLLKVGAKPLILEQERFPCYHIGESLTSEVGVCLRELGLERAMHAEDYPIKHGTNVYGPCGKEAHCEAHVGAALEHGDVVLRAGLGKGVTPGIGSTWPAAGRSGTRSSPQGTRRTRSA